MTDDAQVPQGQTGYQVPIGQQPPAGPRLSPAACVLRPYEWVKNVLLLAPLVLAHVLPWAGYLRTE